MLKRLFILFSLLCLAPVAMADRPKPTPEETLVMELKTGTVTIQMRPDLAPLHVARIKQLVRRGFYDGLAFHRVVPGFLAQTGDPSGTGRGGTGRWLELEPSKEPHVRGTVSMARGMNQNSGDCQFFILMQGDASLDGEYTVWGHVLKGMDLIDRLKAGDKKMGRVTDPDRILSLRIAADPPRPTPSGSTPSGPPPK